ncbi:MAG: AAA family ATPase [Ardenticatenaceae bacterium]|nr:AAA family ATPase [Ardenticatenaceae bacterium]
MTVEAIRLENFMAFADTGWIELQSITLLFGRNSSGKSAIIRALRFLRQNLDEEADYSDNGILKFVAEYGVDLGSFDETIHGGEKYNKRIMRFHFRCAVPEASDMVRKEINIWRQENNLPSIVAGEQDFLSLAISFARTPSNTTELIGIELTCNWHILNDQDSQILLLAQLLDEDTRKEVNYDEWWLDTDLPNWFAQDWRFTTFHFQYNFLPDLQEAPVEVLKQVFSYLAESISTFLKSIEYLGPIRPDPQRIYFLDEIGRQRWRQQGWGAFVDLLEDRLGETLEDLGKWLKYLELGKQILSPINKTAYKDAFIASVEIEEFEEDSNKSSSVYPTLLNMGFGTSQIIPIIVHAVTLRQRANTEQPVYVVIEQPELHLHPQAQARLADVFIKMLLNDKNIEGRYQVRFLLETHSEHLMLRFRRRIAETTFDILDSNHAAFPSNEDFHFYKENFGLVYLERKEGVSKVEYINVDHRGQMVDPSTEFRIFFDDDYKEVESLADAKMAILNIEYGNTHSS